MFLTKNDELTKQIIEMSKKNEAEQLIQKAQSNAKIKYATKADFENYDPTNFNDFLNEYIKGTSSSNVKL